MRHQENGAAEPPEAERVGAAGQPGQDDRQGLQQLPVPLHEIRRGSPGPAGPRSARHDCAEAGLEIRGPA